MRRITGYEGGGCCPQFERGRDLLCRFVPVLEPQWSVFLRTEAQVSGFQRERWRTGRWHSGGGAGKHGGMVQAYCFPGKHTAARPPAGAESVYVRAAEYEAQAEIRT
jgi:hypothetical protein